MCTYFVQRKCETAMTGAAVSFLAFPRISWRVMSGFEGWSSEVWAENTGILVGVEEGEEVWEEGRRKSRLLDQMLVYWIVYSWVGVLGVRDMIDGDCWVDV